MRSRNPLEVHALVVMIAQEGSFVRAARKLGIAQPSLTRRIQSLERKIGVELFERTSRKVELTKAGRLFVTESTVSLNHAERAWNLARYQAQMEHGPYRIGYSRYTHSAFLPLLNELSLLQSSSSREPSGTILESATTRELIERVLRGRLHAALGVSPVVDEELWVQPVGREGFSVCIPKNHRLAQKAAVTVPDLDGEIVFWLPRRVNPGFYGQVAGYIRSVGVEPVFKEVQDTMHALDFASRGFGLALLPRSAARISRTGTVFKPLADRYLGIESVLFMRRDQRHDDFKELMDDLLTRLRALKVEIN
ncbi:MAG TPA: LysR family transcriptional regulator [Terriglobales bacterium]|nr:LysR family transcriptional regulator [Terriglobales bacterium]